MDFKLEAKDGLARAGELKSSHSTIKTPVFMPVGTQGIVKALDAWAMDLLGAKIILANTYHLYLRPGPKLIKELGGLHGFSSYKKSFLTDSGGFQAFSLAANTKYEEDGIIFKSHIDGSKHFFTAKSVLDAQYDFNSDIMMVLDDLVALPASKERVELSLKRTIKWAKQSLNYHKEQRAKGLGNTQNLFAIIQGGTDFKARKDCAQALCELDFDGFAIGGLSVGEENSLMYESIEATTTFMDENRPRYLMGVGTPLDLLEGIERGVDMFDCVMPTRNARNGSLFTQFGKISIKNALYKNMQKPIEEGCACYTCRRFSLGFLHHLFKAKELSFYHLASYHNLYFYLKLMKKAREAIIKHNFKSFKKDFFAKYLY